MNIHFHMSLQNKHIVIFQKFLTIGTPLNSICMNPSQSSVLAKITIAKPFEAVTYSSTTHREHTMERRMRPCVSLQFGFLTSLVVALLEIKISAKHQNTYTWSVAKRTCPSTIIGKQISGRMQQHQHIIR